MCWASREPLPREIPMASVEGVTIAMPGRRISKVRPSRSCTTNGSKGNVDSKLERSLAFMVFAPSLYSVLIRGSTSTM
jgi:hypothetical protein